MAWSVKWKVFIDGNDVTEIMRPTLTSIATTDKDGAASDSCSLEFDDSEGRAYLPRDKAHVVVWINGVKDFEGEVDKVRSKGSRGSGRTISVSAKGFDTKGKVKDGQSWHLDDATLGEALKKSAKKAGYSDIIIDPELASIQREYWSPDGASFLAWGQSLAKELHATFKLRPDKAIFVKRGENSLPTVLGIVSKTNSCNVISWDIHPKSGRKKFAKSEARYFDRKTAKFETVVEDVGSDGSEALNKIRRTVADKDQAKGVLAARKEEAEREGGEGSVSLDFVAHAKAEAPFVLFGARQGVDGKYKITTVVKKANRSGGAVVNIQIKQPEPD